MISYQSSFMHMRVVDGIEETISFSIIRSAKGFLQPLKDVLRLGFLKLMTELIIHHSQYYASNSGLIRDPLLISIFN